MASPALPPWPATPPAAGGVLLRRWTEGRGFSFAVAETATGRAVGGLGVWLPELPQGRAEIGYAVAPTARGHGYATAALIAVTAFA